MKRATIYCTLLLLLLTLPLSGAITSQRAKQSKCQRGKCQKNAPLGSHPSLYVCISFSMPDTAILALSQELKQYHGSFAIQGIPQNSFAAFFEKVTHLKEQGLETPIAIDPDRFEKHHITEVPVVMIEKDDAVDTLCGNVPIAYALEEFAKKGKHHLLAKELLLRGSR